MIHSKRRHIDLGAADLVSLAEARDTDGSRSSFKDWARNHGIDHELSELCLAHVVVGYGPALSVTALRRSKARDSASIRA